MLRVVEKANVHHENMEHVTIGSIPSTTRHLNTHVTDWMVVVTN